MKFKYIGDPGDQTPEGINSGPLVLKTYGYEFTKSMTVVDIPDDALICDSAGRPTKTPMLICKKLANNSHFQVVDEAEPKRRGRKPKEVDFEPSTS